MKSNLAVLSENLSGVTSSPAVHLWGISLEDLLHDCLRGHLEEHVTLVMVAELESKMLITNGIDKQNILNVYGALL